MTSQNPFSNITEADINLNPVQEQKKRGFFAWLFGSKPEAQITSVQFANTSPNREKVQGILNEALTVQTEETMRKQLFDETVKSKQNYDLKNDSEKKFYIGVVTGFLTDFEKSRNKLNVLSRKLTDIKVLNMTPAENKDLELEAVINTQQDNIAALYARIGTYMKEVVVEIKSVK